MTKRKTTPHKSRHNKHQVSLAAVNAIIQRVANGETLTSICAADGMPGYQKVMERINLSSSLVAAFARARERAAERMLDELRDITDNTRIGEIKTTGPKGVEIKEADMLGHRTLQVDTRKWLLSKLMPHRFGDRVEHSGSMKVEHEHSLSPTMLANLDALRARLPALPSVVLDAQVVDTKTTQGT